MTNTSEAQAFPDVKSVGLLTTEDGLHISGDDWLKFALPSDLEKFMDGNIKDETGWASYWVLSKFEDYSNELTKAYAYNVGNWIYEQNRHQWEG